MAVIMGCNGKYYLQIIAKSWRYIIFAKKGINNEYYNNHWVDKATELIESLDFTEEDYNEKIAGEDVASFKRVYRCHYRICRTKWRYFRRCNHYG